MKTVKLLLIGTAFTALNSCGLKHNEVVEKQNVEKILPPNKTEANHNKGSENEIEEMLLTYYTEHLKIWEADSIPPIDFKKKLDSLMQMYCTKEFRTYAQDGYMASGSDVPTYNHVGLKANENLNTPIPTNNNGLKKVITMKDLLRTLAINSLCTININLFIMF
jgi:hypothetical protein